MRVIGTDTLTDILADDNSPPEIKEWAQNQPIEELAFRVVATTLLLKSRDNVYYQYQPGFLSEEAWTALRAQLQTARSWCKAMFEDNPAIWRASFQKLLREMLNQSGRAVQ